MSSSLSTTTTTTFFALLSSPSSSDVDDGFFPLAAAAAGGNAVVPSGGMPRTSLSLSPMVDVDVAAVAAIDGEGGFFFEHVVGSVTLSRHIGHVSSRHSRVKVPWCARMASLHSLSSPLGSSFSVSAQGSCTWTWKREAGSTCCSTLSGAGIWYHCDGACASRARPRNRRWLWSPWFTTQTTSRPRFEAKRKPLPRSAAISSGSRRRQHSMHLLARGGVRGVASERGPSCENAKMIMLAE